MNIGFFTDTYQKGHSGVERSMETFKEELEKQGHKVYIFAPLDDKRLNTPEENKNGIYRLQAMSQDFFPEFKLTFPISAKVLKNFGNFNLDIIHSHTPFIMGFYANFVGFALNIPVIHTYHTFYEKYTGHSFMSSIEKADQAMMKVVTNITLLHSGRCDHVIVPSEKIKRVLEEYGIENELSVIPTGININEFQNVDKEQFRKELGIKSNEKIILYVGRIAPEKNLVFLLELARKLKEKRSDFKVVFVGKGLEEPYLKELVDEKNIGDVVIFAGHKMRKGVLEAFAGSDIFTFPSLTDTQGLALSEAVASGLPIVMLRDPGLINIVKDGINGYEVSDLDSFTEKIEYLLDHEEARKTMGQESVRLADAYAIEIKTDQLIEVYEKTIKDFDSGSIRSKMRSTISKDFSLKEVFGKGISKEKLRSIGKRTKKLFSITKKS